MEAKLAVGMHGMHGMACMADMSGMWGSVPRSAAECVSNGAAALRSKPARIHCGSGSEEVGEPEAWPSEYSDDAPAGHQGSPMHRVVALNYDPMDPPVSVDSTV